MLLRPGPYVCGEYDLGGLPWWLLRDREMRLRSQYPGFLSSVRRYYKALGEQLAPLQATKGGPIVMVQVENEYDGHGRDDGYIEVLCAALRESGFEVPLCTSEMAWSLRPSKVPGLIRGVGFSGDPDRHFADLRRVQPNGPMFCSELYTGWYDVWGRGSSTDGPFQTLTNTLERVLSLGASFNLYVVHGGTSFGFSAGANNPPFRPTPTSYDYGAPIDEAGRPTAKYHAIREVMARHLPRGQVLPPIPALVPSIALPAITFREAAPVLKNLPGSQRDRWPKTMEALGQGQGCVLYRTRLPAGRAAELLVTDPHDFVVVLLDGRPLGTLDRMRRERSLWLPERREEATLDLLVEAMGHVNFGPDMEQDRKGITERVEIDEGLGRREVLDWEMFPIPLSVPSLAKVKYERAGKWEAGGRKTEPGNPRGLREPTFFRATFDLKELGDTFLDLRQWSKGVVWVNGHNLGRYWSLGPQQTLYLPGPWLKLRGNEIIVLDLLGPTKTEIRGRTNAILNELNLAGLGRLHRQTGQRLKLDGVKAVAEGSFLPESGWQMAKFEPVQARYVCLEARSSLANDGYTTCAELNLVDAAGQNIPKAGWRILYADSEEVLAEDASADRVLDGRSETFWHTRWDGSKDPLPHHLVIDLGEEHALTGVRYLPRQDKPHGRIGEYRIYATKSPLPGL